MDVANVRVLIVMLLVIGLASAQVNFSTSWGKRSPSVLSAAPASSAQGSYLALRQKLHSKKEPGMESQHNVLPDSDSGAQTVYDEAEAEDQRTSGLLPSPCLSLLKVLMLVNQIAETELQKVEKYDRQQQ
ncbi:uncharacterized protein LOC116927696 [Daphnia magna]|uniref:uncharacterized protein LOC116927696 n=1 Tax=Daphnia magna TaxID=35525 RepID=UPI001E1BD989|nr:uncharacterized protein LOC116927696 [Daphnia magna]